MIEAAKLEADIYPAGPRGLSAYEIYKKEGGQLSEEEWLKSLNGLTPTIGENGNWFLGTVDTGLPSRGPKGDTGSIKFIVVTELPTENIDETAIYLKPVESPTGENKFEELIYVNGKWEDLGTPNVAVDLSNYYTKEESDTNLNDTISENMPLFINAPKYADFVGEKTTEIFRKWYNNYKNGKYIPIMLYTHSRTDWKYVYCFLTGIHDDGTSRLYLYFANMKVNSSNEIIPSTISYAPTYIVYSGTPDKSFVSINANNDNGSLPFKQITNITNSTISNYTLTKANTTAYTPTKDYHPSTKKYVDDSLKSFVPTPEVYMVVKEDSLSPMTITDESTLETVSNAINQIKNNKGAIILFTFGSITRATYVGIIQPHNLTDTNVVIDLINSTGMYGAYYDIRVKGTTTNNVFTATKLEIMQWNSSVAGVGQVLTKTNTEKYTPTADYNPATKKYVDDNVKTYTAGENITISDDNVISATISSGNYTIFENYNEWDTPENRIAFFTEVVNVLKEGKRAIILPKYQNHQGNDTFANNMYTSPDVSSIDLSTYTGAIRFRSQRFTTIGVAGIYGEVYSTDSAYIIAITLTNGVVTNVPTPASYSYASGTLSILSKSNAISYTPTGDYNPSTKLYTDKTHYENMAGYDATKTQVLKNINGTLTWVDEA